MIKLNKKQIGKIQVYLGIFVLLATIIGAYFVITTLFYQNLVNGARVMTEYWGEASQQYDTLNLEIQAQVLTGMVLLSGIYTVGLYIFCLGCIILVVLSLFLILQGLAKQKKQK